MEILLYFFPEIIFLFGIIFIFIFGLYKKDYYSIMVFSIWILTMTILGCNNFKIDCVIFFFNNLFIISPFIQFLKTVILFLGIIIIYVNYNYWETTNHKYEVYVLILLLIWNFLILISINELVLLVLFMEMHGIIAFTLTGIRKDNSLAKEAMIKFYVLGAIATGFMALGITIIYLILGSTNLHEISILIIDFYSINIVLKYYITLILGIIFFVFGFLFKLALVPFHFWIGDVYHSAPLGIILFFATIPVLSYTFLFSKILFLLNIDLVIDILLLSMMYGTFMSLYQVRLMRLIGYSAIIHICYALLGIIQGNLLSLKIGMFYIIFYCFLNLGLFLIIIILKDKKLINELHLIEIIDFFKILRCNTFLSSVCVTIFFSMAGIPPLGGFFTKLYVFLGLTVNYSYLIFFILLVLGIITSVYYIRLIRLLFFNANVKIDNIKILDKNIIFILLFILIVNIFFFIINLYFIIYIFSLV